MSKIQIHVLEGMNFLLELNAKRVSELCIIYNLCTSSIDWANCVSKLYKYVQCVYFRLFLLTLLNMIYFSSSFAPARLVPGSLASYLSTL